MTTSWKPTLYVVLALVSNTLAAVASPGRPNVLFIAIDDLRPQLGCYGDPIARTPNLDKLAAEGLRFNRAYCQQAVCSPSRSSLLTGRRPDTTKVYNLKDHFRSNLPDVVTLPQHFKNNGYHTQGFGKIFHDGLDDPASWSVPLTPTHGPIYGPEESAKHARRREQLIAEGVKGDELARRSKGIPWEAPDVNDNELLDGITADGAIQALRTMKDKPFFLAVGFIRPHLPFVAPKKYFDLDPPAEQIKLPPDMDRPAGAPDVAFTNFGELRAYRGMPKGDEPVPDKQARELIRAYYAATSYTDALVGRLLGELDQLGLRGNTIVIAWGDHGWHLGEQGQWCKHTNFENATRAPLIISIPGQVNRGAKTDALVEFVDVYPSLVELAGLPPASGLEGTSFVPLLKDPTHAWKSAAFSQYPRQGGKIMGYTMRTDRYRYTAWLNKAGESVAVELYDHDSDPRETRNVADAPANKEKVKAFGGQLKAGWRAALPPSTGG
jgi:arylsulfatase A-like enzyme